MSVAHPVEGGGDELLVVGVARVTFSERETRGHLLENSVHGFHGGAKRERPPFSVPEQHAAEAVVMPRDRLEGQ